MNFIIILFLLLLPFSVQAVPPSEESRECMDILKTQFDYMNWPEENSGLISFVDLSKEYIPSIESATKMLLNKYERRVIEVFTDTDIHEYCTLYRYEWKTSREDQVTISLYVNTSSHNAREYLIYKLTWRQVPPERDIVPIAGEVSFNNGGAFVRNNIIVTVGALGDLNKMKPDFAKEVDKILLQQKTYAAAEVMPHLSELSFEKYDTQIAKISFTSSDPREGKADWEYRLSRGSIYKKEENALYLNGRLTGEFDVIVIAVNESGFTTARSLSITATEDDIFN